MHKYLINNLVNSLISFSISYKNTILFYNSNMFTLSNKIKKE